ncbi:MAG: cation-translocating P-type ATPase [Desulfohalobiaceae bacterium]|nr:cation-translocating P-type ATPase [Desulfohalobiaceae bacterium]
MPVSKTCALCGLPLRRGGCSAEFNNTAYPFCCQGCRQVFTILMQDSDSADPEEFRETELYKQCLRAGIIPASEADLDRPGSRETRENPAKTEQDGLPLTLRVSNMWCPACAWLIETALGKVPGVLTAECHFSTDRVHLRYDPVQTSPDRIMQAIAAMGYRAETPDADHFQKELREDFIRFGISAFLTMNIMLLSFSLYSGFFTSLSQATIFNLSWPILIMATGVLGYGGQRIFQKATFGFSSIAFSMETLIGTAALSAYLFSVYHVFQGDIHLYFDTASMLITLTLLGKLLEKNAKAKVRAHLENFFSLRPKHVRICTDRFPRGRYVAADHLEAGDIFLVEDGETAAADGSILSGRARVDESSLTGEAAPVLKKAGKRIKSGTRVVSGRIRVRAEQVGEDSTLNQMISIMDQALHEKTALEGKTERILQWFVPAVLGLALMTGLGWLIATSSLETAMLRGVTVLVIACPCALGIAIPLTRVAGISVAGRRGILVRDFSAFERAGHLETIVFDKTGTLTTGEWSLQEIIPLNGYSKKEVLELAAELENGSEHHLGAEIRRRAALKKLDPDAEAKIEDICLYDNGLSGRMGNQVIKMGSRDFCAPEILSSDLAAGPSAALETSLVFMSIDGRLCGLFAFGDRIRQSAAETVQRLDRAGFSTALVSGDGHKTTRTIAERVGIKNSMGGFLPQQKADYIQSLQEKGAAVAMIGDGINDAPAMARADLAVAVHSGNHLGQEVADLSLMRGDPAQFPDFLELSARVNKKVRQNLVFAFVYNTLGLPIAMSGLLTPLIAVSAMFLSSLTVIGNTLLLIRSEFPRDI